MKYFLKSNLLLGCLMCLSLPALSNPVERAVVIAEPAWVAHLDVDALRKSAVGAQILAEMKKPEADLHFAMLKAAVGNDLRTTLHGITVYGASANPEDGVALVYADLNSERLLSLAQLAEDYRETSHGQHQIASWIDDKRRKKEGGKPRTYAAIYQNRLVIFAQQESSLAEALEVLDGTKKNLGQGSDFPKFGAGEPEILQAAVRHLNGHGDGPPAAILKLSKLISLDVREADEKVLANLYLETTGEDAAQQVANIARGIIALMGLPMGNPDAVTLSKHLSVEQTGANATVRLDIPANDIIAAIKDNAAKEAAKKASADNDDDGKVTKDKDGK
ncbi:MAG TPA: hypothetical protein VFC44_15670 [Candidatus Saccharimonadales bacterium]|nr:hypothetical protein [Candidatus Saccharimonadales bacterium]